MNVNDNPITQQDSERKKYTLVAPALRMLYAGEENAVAMFCWGASGGIADKDLLTLADGASVRDAFSAHQEKYGQAPCAVRVGESFFALGKDWAQADAVRQAMGASSFHVPTNSAAPEVAGGRMKDKVCLVTGAAQGFGQGIANALAAQGAYVVIADMNIAGADAFAAELNERFGDGTAVAVSVNVADEASVAQMVDSAVLAYGGLDLLVSNAGIAIAGDLTEMTKDHFEKVTAVNYTGYFLCTKYATEPMKIQREYRPNYLMDVIEINSKSGLEGSNKNFAYAGSKFGGIGLTQSFALELVPFGIKVNAICPGNLLDGPLWSDPERGLFRQYFEAGKVPSATCVEDVRRHYEAKVPMNRGCTVEDVACAIFYLVDQKYETGQALPVTGGQIMLK